MNHECVIGMRYEYDNTNLVTLADLKEYIESEKQLADSHKDSMRWQSVCNKYSLTDYCDRRKNTDLTHFNFCPMCGKEIDWKAIKKGARENDRQEISL